jgi:hypothetical protein
MDASCFAVSASIPISLFVTIAECVLEVGIELPEGVPFHSLEYLIHADVIN